ncbi:MAG: tRNA (5-methylaminomethyl-2-thiouridine)(34)-methyltransferase MnmD [Gammaproteobacteria bacterium]|nr:tRNA (5-methylaminomethyl-2-thiouridine)(34)-methyltransferase MnmD [Gammaproteobacteria bacterium]
MENGEPYSELFQDYYFSTDGGFIETEYVFLKHNGFPQRFYDLEKKPASTSLKIAETGFGTGLNFLITCFHWLQVSDLTCTLEYTSVEKYPLTKSQLQQIYLTFSQNWPQLTPYCTELLQQYPQYIADPEIKHFEFELFDRKIRLNLLIDDATAGLKQLLPMQNNTIDAWYLDGFAPAKNPDMWQAELFKTVANLSKSGATISTFTAAGFVRRSLTRAGFSMSRAPGLGKKREILFGVRQ